MVGMEAHLEGLKRECEGESGDRNCIELFPEVLPWSTVEKLGGDTGEHGVVGGLFIYVLKLEYIREYVILKMFLYSSWPLMEAGTLKPLYEERR